MPFSLPHRSKASLFTTGLVIVMTLTALAFGFRPPPRKPAAVATPLPAQNPNNKERIPTILATLTRFGFQPAALKLPEGKCLIVVRNISGAENIQLELTRVRGAKLVAEKPKEGKPFWEKPLSLHAGEYTLSVTENPRWSLALTVFSPEKK